MSRIPVCTSTGDLPGSNTGNDPYQNYLATWTEVKALHKQQNSHIQSNTQTNLDLQQKNVEYGFHLNIDILELSQPKASSMIVHAPCYLPKTVIRRDFQTPKVKDEITHYSYQYSGRLSFQATIV
jgi:hypothetical protein